MFCTFVYKEALSNGYFLFCLMFSGGGHLDQLSLIVRKLGPPSQKLLTKCRGSDIFRNIIEGKLLIYINRFIYCICGRESTSQSGYMGLWYDQTQFSVRPGHSSCEDQLLS